ncbi:hypothetical protein B0H14DRAFT_3476107 [Mycena olivaceomarginata]|nr:hypothetical protein B0H14DRAFT_3476107 [Mycena olivaceomarginata]
MQNIRLFLEPNPDRPLPELDVTRSTDITFGRDDGIQIKDVIWAFYTCPSHSSDPLIQNIFITHFNEGIVALRDVVEKSYSNTSTIQWVLHTINNIILFLSTPNQLALLQVSARTIEHFGTILADRGSDWEWVVNCLFNPFFRHLWRTGLLDNALQVSTLGRNDEALTAAQEAVSVYTENAPHMWGRSLYAIRKQELGANAFHALSLRLVTSGTAEKALLNAEKATELYREAITLAPRLLPTLASSLRNLGSILWDVGRRDEAIAACEEVVGIMWQVASSETYLLPALAEALEQLAGYLREKGDVGGVSAAAAECTEVQREFAALPPGPEFLFEEVVDMVESDDKEEGWAEADEYHDASESPSANVVESDDKVDEYHTASEAPTSVEPLAFILESSSHSLTSAPGPSTEINASVQSKPGGISIAAENSDIVVLNGSSAVESKSK